MTTTGWVATLLIIIGIAGGAWWFASKGAPAAPTTQETPTDQTGASGTVPANDSGMPDSGVLIDAGAGATVGGDAVVSAASKTVAVTYGASGFSPKSITINAGDTVTFTNQGGGNMWVGADEHPTHTEYDGTTRSVHCASGYTGEKPFDQCGVGISYSFTFTKTGTFDYHNHSAAQFGGTVIVK